MRKRTQQIKEAFEQGTSKKVGNTRTDGQTVWLHGNAIVKHDPDGLVRWSLAGWNTKFYPPRPWPRMGARKNAPKRKNTWPTEAETRTLQACTRREYQALT